VVQSLIVSENERGAKCRSIEATGSWLVRFGVGGNASRVAEFGRDPAMDIRHRAQGLRFFMDVERSRRSRVRIPVHPCLPHSAFSFLCSPEECGYDSVEGFQKHLPRHCFLLVHSGDGVGMARQRACFSSELIQRGKPRQTSQNPATHLAVGLQTDPIPTLGRTCRPWPRRGSMHGSSAWERSRGCGRP
jgi:hypothetical protein